jgi:NAD(P)H-flavin reductase/ferredoxin
MKIHILPFERSFECDEDETVLEAALRQGLFLRYGCRAGGCSSCRAQVLSGEADIRGSSFALTDSDRNRGWVLACCTSPLEDLVLDVSTMDLTEDEFLAGDTTGRWTSVLEEVTSPTRDMRAVTLRLVDPPEMTFSAGQFVNVEVPGTSEVRSFSMMNPPSQGGVVQLLVKLLPGGLFSEYLERGARIGDRVALQGPLGLFKVRLSHRPMVMIAGGSGLAPILSMIADQGERLMQRPVTLLYGARSQQDLCYADRITSLGERLPGFRLVPVLSDEPAGSDWRGARGFVHELLASTAPDLRDHDAYLCGPPAMIAGAIPVLVKAGVRERNVYFDAFVPSGTQVALVS